MANWLNYERQIGRKKGIIGGRRKRKGGYDSTKVFILHPWKQNFGLLSCDREIQKTQKVSN